MVPENRKKRLLDARSIVARKRARGAASLAGNMARPIEEAPARPSDGAAPNPLRGSASPGTPAASLGAHAPLDEEALGSATASWPLPIANAPLPLQARKVDAVEQPRAHTTCKRCAATVPADAVECWNCGLRIAAS